MSWHHFKCKILNDVKTKIEGTKVSKHWTGIITYMWATSDMYIYLMYYVDTAIRFQVFIFVPFCLMVHTSA